MEDGVRKVALLFSFGVRNRVVGVIAAAAAVAVVDGTECVIVIRGVQGSVVAVWKRKAVLYGVFGGFSIGFHWMYTPRSI